ncbi:response regulator [Halofilum ochraceum]|uniref:response regulator n=1 Tax=Halofilum ochraceum TaxID=1611323 RepID=UPI000836349F|nr:response regulator transcription factor [Halofilum ochraceum]
MSDPDAKQTLRVALVDDHGLVRSALARLVDSCLDMKVVVETTDGPGLIEAMRDTPVDVATIDAVIPGGNGFETIRDLAQTHPDVRSLVLSIYVNATYVSNALEAGAHGFVAKGADASQFLGAIRSVARGERFIVAPVEPDPVDAESVRPGPSGASPVALTPRQREILQLIVDGLRTAEIAHRLRLDVKTVESHRASLMRRMEVRNIAALVREALRLELASFAP